MNVEFVGRAVVPGLVFLALPFMALASSSSALKRYEAGKYESALREYKRLLLDKPDDPRLHFNAGAAAFQVNDFEEARKQLNSALVTQDLQLQEKTYYNLGNTEYRAGAEVQAPDKKQANWEQAIANYESALKLNPKDEDAKFNLEMVKKKLEELQKQQQQQKDNQKQDDQKKDDQKKDDQQKDQSKQDQQQKDDKSKQQEQKQSDQQKQQQQQQNQETKKPEDEQQKKDASKPENKKDEAKNQQGEKKDSSQEKPDDQQAQAQKGMIAQMTPQQAQQLLDAQKNEEKPLIFIPKLKTNRMDRVFKDW